MGFCRPKEASKSKPLLFAGSVSKKGEAKPALFLVKKQRNTKDGLTFRCWQNATLPHKKQGLAS
jgi:hypothetical protein